MANLVVGCLLLVASAQGLKIPASFGRRDLARLAGAGAIAVPLAAIANTAPELSEPMKGFDATEDKRAAFLVAQKKFKKAWRKQVANFEFATTDSEAIAATDAMYKLIMDNNGQVPEGVKKADLDSVYKRVQPKLGKNARMEFLKLDKLVLDIQSVKGLNNNYSID